MRINDSKLFLRVCLMFVFGFMAVSTSVFGASRERPVEDILQASGRWIYNWSTEMGAPGYFAIVSRDDRTAAQSSYDSSQINVAGKVTETDDPDGRVKVQAVLRYSNLPLEVWAMDAEGTALKKVVDNGQMSGSMNITFYIPKPGAPLNILDCFDNPDNCPFTSFTGNGTAEGTGQGDFAAGQQVSVKITQTGNTRGNARAGKDGWPAENITLK